MARGEITGKKPTVTAHPGKRPRGPPSANPDAVESTPHSEPQSSASVKTPPIRGPPLAMSIRQFCALHGGISEDLFYKMQREGWGPATMKVGSRTLVSAESAARWRAEREAAAKEAAENEAA
jgi:hypothetical protein